MKIIGATISRDLPFPKKSVEDLLRAPALIVNWHPWVEEISIFEQEGLLYRKSRLSGGETELVEKFWEDEDGDGFHFQVVQGLWADNRYRTKISIEEKEAGCCVTWQGRMMAEVAEDESEQMEAFYDEGLKGLESFLSEMA